MIDRYRESLILQAWFSPAFPTGGFAYSHGLETAIEKGLISDATTLYEWLYYLLIEGSGRNDGIFITAALNGQNDINELYLCLCAGAERQREALEMGQAFTRTINADYAVTLPDGLAYPIAIGSAAKQMRLDGRLTIQSYLQAFISNLISVGVRLIPIGQQAGQHCLISLFPILVKLSAEICTASLDQLGNSAFLSDLMTLQHEIYKNKVYRT